VLIELFLYDARFDNGPSLFDIHVENAIQVFGHVDDNGVAHGLAGQAGSGAPRQNGYSKFSRDFHRGEHVFMRAWNDDADGFDFVDAGVGTIEESRNAVESYFPADPLL
jgi:hypothetical protein